jgi:formate dehydrogenase subunit gamma
MARKISAAFTLAAALAVGPALAQQTPQPPRADEAAAAQQVERQRTQPLNNAPIWREVRSGAPQSTTVRGIETDVLVQPRGETWRQARVPIAFWGGVLLALSIAGLAAFYLVRGPLGADDRPTGRLIERFSVADRAAHWLLAIAWVILAITGLVLSLGKEILLPLIGYTLFSALATIAKNLHNFVGPVLIVAVPWLFLRFVRDNGIGREDVKWLLKLGDFLRGREYPSGRFNGAEKLLFWILLVVLTTTLLVTGLILNFPNFGQGRVTMQNASLIHMIAAYLAIALAMLHIYVGTIGVKGAYQGMRTGYVDETWAKHNHAYWYEDVKAGRARQKFAQPGEGPAEGAAPAVDAPRAAPQA